MSRIGNLTSRIFVGGMDPSVSEVDLEKAFKLFGEITNVMVMRDRENGRSRGFAFISFKDAQASDQAISRMHGVEIRGRCVSVRHAEKEKFVRDDRPKRGGFRGGRISTGSRSENFRDQPAYRGNGHQSGAGYGMSRPPSDIVYVVRDDKESGYSRRSRSPLGGPRYRPESPPRRMGERRGYSPPLYQSRPLSPPQRPGSSTLGESEYFNKPIRRVTPSPPDYGFSRFKENQELSPARELGAYIRARDHSPSFARQSHKLSPEPVHRRRSPSPAVNRPYSDRNVSQRSRQQSDIQKYNDESSLRFDSRNNQTNPPGYRDSGQQVSSSAERYRDSSRHTLSAARYNDDSKHQQPSSGRFRDPDTRDEYRFQPNRRDDTERFSPSRSRDAGSSSLGDRQIVSAGMSRGGRETGRSTMGYRESTSPRQHPRDMETGSRESESYRPRGSTSVRGGYRGGGSTSRGNNYRDRSPRRDSRNIRQEDRDRQQPPRYRSNYEEKRTSPMSRRPTSSDRGPPGRSPRGRSPPRRGSPPPRRY
uniref:serine/arginine repetitive matrix protein 1-like n=1 Tax=Styela clava TaxID=7725 RepID=UPI00193AA6EF|nr:serine/arginine repetitive matrix protein 1-like [Styela clava]